jgi:hypothetical protein
VGGDNDWAWVEAQSRYTCGARGGQLYCWGRTDSTLFEALGITTTVVSPYNLPFDPGSYPVLGGDAMCALDGGRWKCVGANATGQVGVDSTEPAITEPTALCPGT